MNIRYFIEGILIKVLGIFRRKQHNTNRFYTRKIRRPAKSITLDPLDRHLDQIFSSKQKELFMKKINGKELTKTEKEYFSRTVKKKVLAMANQDLHHMSKKLLQ
ncbi:MAG: hypothetical protein ABIH39_08805 [Candidatus Margulisiibacteriota bacterium]